MCRAHSELGPVERLLFDGDTGDDGAPAGTFDRTFDDGTFDGTLDGAFDGAFDGMFDDGTFGVIDGTPSWHMQRNIPEHSTLFDGTFDGTLDRR